MLALLVWSGMLFGGDPGRDAFESGTLPGFESQSWI